jgi:hypothetical protein
VGEEEMDRLQRLRELDRHMEVLPTPPVNLDSPTRQRQTTDCKKEWDDIFDSMTQIEMMRYLRGEE